MAGGQLALPFGPPQQATPPEPRLFVPLANDPFIWFVSGKKKWELRREGRAYTPKHLRTGRRVELRRGYSDAKRALWGAIVETFAAPSLYDFFERVPYQEVIPEARSLEEAIERARVILRVNANSDAVIGFRVALDDPTHIPLASQYVDLVRSGQKRATVRAGKRSYRLGPGMLDAGAVNIPIWIDALDTKRVGELTDEDAKLDGFSGLAELRSALMHHYPAIKDDDPVTVVRFSDLTPSNED